jgi:hypothetical protein
MCQGVFLRCQKFAFSRFPMKAEPEISFACVSESTNMPARLVLAVRFVPSPLFFWEK